MSPELDEPRDFKLIPSLSDVWNERFSGWPSFQVHLELAPWYWRVGFYRAPTDGHFILIWLGPVVMHLWA